jgi:phospholipase/lecithinase/hemolysin
MTRALVLVIVAAFSSPAAPITSLFFFGDSLSDTGNVYAATSLLSGFTLGLVPVQPASPPYYAGHFSNGPVWTETVAARLSHPGDAAPAGMSLGILGSLPGAGHNYAIGGARTGVGGALGVLDPLIPTGVLAQVSYYLSGHAADPNAMYFLLGGGNDLRDAAAITDPNAQVQFTYNAAFYLAYAVNALYQGGARQFMLLNAPNVGMVPESIIGGRIESGTVASLYFNYFLGAFATYLTQLPGISLGLFDVYDYYNQVLSDTFQGGSRFGFTSLTPCIDGAVSCDATLFFDTIHPTARMHALLGNSVADQVLGSMTSSALTSFSTDNGSVPEPATGGLVLVSVLTIAAIRRRVDR